jgi:aminoglycoside phosphotransferase (APT) family kinase protein
MMHDDQIDITVDVVRALVANQFPAWSNQPIRRIESGGTVNAIFRIGEEFAARFPLRPGDPEVLRQDLEIEARAVAELARHSPVPAPIPVALGNPGPGYALPWSVQTWVNGTIASDDDASESVAFAVDLATLVAALRRVDTAGRRFSGVGRGGELRDHDEWVELCIRNTERLFEVAGLSERWSYFRDLPRAAPDVMTHGDLIPPNVLVGGGRLVGVLDGGGFGPADPALDVIAGWHLLDEGPRTVFRDSLHCDDLEWERSKAWAFVQALGAGWYYVDSNPAMFTMGRRTLDRVIAETA